MSEKLPTVVEDFAKSKGRRRTVYISSTLAATGGVSRSRHENQHTLSTTYQ
jgi:hypothetical protein